MNSILIVGVGCVGALMGASLIKAGWQITFAGKPESEYTQKLKAQGIKIRYSHGERYQILPSHPQINFVDTATNLGKIFDLIIVAVKSNNLLQVASYIKAHSNPSTILIHAQNGIPYWWFNNDQYLTTLDRSLLPRLSSRPYLDTVDKNGILQKNLGDRIIVGCVVKAPCQRSVTGQIEIRKPPQLILGLTTPRDLHLQEQTMVQNLCRTFSQHGVAAVYTNNIRVAVCNKLAINLTTNVLSALTGKVIADLTANHVTNSLTRTIVAELNRIFLVYGVEPQDLPSKEAIYSYIMAPGSQTHLPSLAQDLSQHKPGEINLITAPVEMAKIARLKVPTLSSLSELLKLCQTYSLKNPEGKSHILTFDHHSGYCMLTNDVCQSSVVDQRQISNLLTYLIQVNASAIPIEAVAS